MAAPLLHPLPDDRWMGRRPAQRARHRLRRPRRRGRDRILPLLPRRGDAESYQLFHLCFWCFAGFYVVYFSVPFMRTAEESDFPRALGQPRQNNKTVRQLRRRSIRLGADRSFRRALDILVQRRARRRDGGVARLRAAHRRWRNLRAGNRIRSPALPAGYGRRTRGGPSPKNTASPRARRKY